MAKQEVMHGPVPVARVLVPGHTIPPVAVEAAVREAREFGEHVEHALPDDIPAEQLLQQHGEQHVRHDPGELFPALVERHAGVLGAHREHHDRVDVRLRDDDHDPDDAERGTQFFRYVPPVYVREARVFEVVDERGQTGPVEEVGEG